MACKRDLAMPSANSQDDRNLQTNSALVESVCRQIRSQLENEKQRIYEEIKQYPRPMPACDLQVNFLVEQRASIARELECLREVSGQGLQGSDALKLLAEFIGSSSHLDDVAKQKFTACLKEDHSGHDEARAGLP